MCGIAGAIGIDPLLAEPAALAMLAALRHRGPDDSGIERVAQAGGPPVVLVHTRLAIVDLSSAGHQPMYDRPTDARMPRNLVTFNGELYNFRELHAELAGHGWPCRTRCDTEVLLNAYRVWGIAAVERLDGMFAWCLVDPAQGRAWLCRDRVGIKPLYLFRPATGGLLFASELRALLAVGEELVPRRIHRPALESFLAQGAVIGEASIVDGVELLGAGESLVVDLYGRSRHTTRYWSVGFGTASGREGERSSPPSRRGLGAARGEAVAALGSALQRSVRGQLLADVPVGVFLSSGVDSAAVATLASEVLPSTLHTIAVGFDQPEYDETAGAQAIARALGTRHSTVRLGGAEVLHDFDAVLGALDQPSVDGFNSYYVCRAARSAGLTVALSGLGGDELFGGYASFRDLPRAMQLARLLAHVPLLGATRRPLRALARRLGSVHAARALVKLAEVPRRPVDLVQLYLLRRELFFSDQRRLLHENPLLSDPTSGIPRGLLRELQHGHSGREPLDRIAYYEFSVYMRHMLLRDADVMSMAHGLELRVPLLGHPVVEAAARARAAFRRPDPRPKPLLVDAVGPRLPAQVWRAQKRGFTFPWDAWLRGPLRASLRERLREPSPWQAAGLDPGAVQRLLGAFERGDPAVGALQMLALVVLSDFVQRLRLRA